jgi:hypothetical protein
MFNLSNNDAYHEGDISFSYHLTLTWANRNGYRIRSALCPLFLIFTFYAPSNPFFCDDAKNS